MDLNGISSYYSRVKDPQEQRSYGVIWSIWLIPWSINVMIRKKNDCEIDDRKLFVKTACQGCAEYHNESEISPSQKQTQADSRQVCLKSLHNHFKLTTGATPRIPPSLTCLFARSSLKQLGSIETSTEKKSKCQFASGWWIVFFIPALQ